MSSEVEMWQHEIHKTHDIMSDDAARPMRYIVGKQGDSLAESVTSVALNEAAALLALGEEWGSGLIVQVLDVKDWTLYTFDTKRETRPIRLADADNVRSRGGDPWEDTWDA